MNEKLRFLALWTGALLVPCAVSAHAARPAAEIAPLFVDLASPAVPLATRNALAQRYFAQGVVLVWGFNAAEAARSFDASIATDPRCALCHWALAWSLGPTLNADMADADVPRIRAALARASAAARDGKPRDRLLIEALRIRHPPAGPMNEDAYAKRMRALANAQPRDADLAVLAAEAQMNLHPYDWWGGLGAPRPWTAEIVSLLSRALRLEPWHPGANHYWVHLMESSSQPGAALESADRLTSLVPGSGHLLHMPAHIYMRVGRYADAVAASRRSIAADARYLAQVDAQRAYRVGYVAHNHHFLWAAAAMHGRSREAIDAARSAFPAACGTGPRDRSSGVLQQYFVLPYFALVRFGRWREILEDTLPPDVAEPYPLAIWHYARGTALARLGRLGEARRELEAVARFAAAPALARERIKNINPANAMVRIAHLTLAADIASMEARPTDAVALLEQATALEDSLVYDEPHLWLAPTRHSLGAALVAAGRLADAERVYRDDLAHYPGNGWSLAGLAKAQRLRGDVDGALATERAFQAAWQHADVALTGSRF